MHQLSESNARNGNGIKASDTATRKTIYIGPIIQSKSLNELDICLEGAIGVNEHGKIAFVSRDQTLPLDEEWKDAKCIRLSNNEFFFPGFIGMLRTIEDKNRSNEPNNR